MKGEIFYVCNENIFYKKLIICKKKKKITRSKKLVCLDNRSTKIPMDCGMFKIMYSFI